jgi:hypothetical protein
MSHPLIESYHDARADAYAGVEEAVGDRADAKVERIGELMHKPDERDPIIWAEYFEYYGVDEEFFDDPVMDLLAVPLDERDKEWHDVITAFASAAADQAWAEVVMIPWLTEAQGGAVESHKALSHLTRKEIKVIGRTGLARFDGAKEKRAAAKVQTG